MIKIDDIMAVKEQKTVDTNNNNTQTEDKNSYWDRDKSTIQKVLELARKQKSEGPVTHNPKHPESKETAKSKKTKSIKTNTPVNPIQSQPPKPKIVIRHQKNKPNLNPIVIYMGMLS